MRTYEDVKIALKHYHDELANEASAKQPRYIIIGGNMCVIKKGSAQYILGKGDPIPMVKDTAKKKITYFQEKCGDNIKLEVIKYSAWLNDNINECNHLISCMQKSITGESDGGMVNEPNIHVNPVHEKTHPIEMRCPDCPYQVNTCMTCRFMLGIRTTIVPWGVICGAPVNEKQDDTGDEI